MRVVLALGHLGHLHNLGKLGQNTTNHKLEHRQNKPKSLTLSIRSNEA